MRPCFYPDFENVVDRELSVIRLTMVVVMVGTTHALSLRHESRSGVARRLEGRRQSAEPRRPTGRPRRADRVGRVFAGRKAPRRDRRPAGPDGRSADLGRRAASTAAVGARHLRHALRRELVADGKLVAFGCSDNTVPGDRRRRSGKQVFFNGAHTDWVLDTVFSAKSDHLISVGRDMSMKLYEVETQRFIDNITSITPGASRAASAAVDRHPTKDELLCAGSDGEPKIYKMVRTQARQIGDDFNLLRKFPEAAGPRFMRRASAGTAIGSPPASASTARAKYGCSTRTTPSRSPCWKDKAAACLRSPSPPTASRRQRRFRRRSCESATRRPASWSPSSSRCRSRTASVEPSRNEQSTPQGHESHC